jgi:hypothetical protein
MLSSPVRRPNLKPPCFFLLFHAKRVPCSGSRMPRIPSSFTMVLRSITDAIRSQILGVFGPRDLGYHPQQSLAERAVIWAGLEVFQDWAHPIPSPLGGKKEFPGIIMRSTTCNYDLLMWPCDHRDWCTRHIRKPGCASKFLLKIFILSSNKLNLSKFWYVIFMRALLIYKGSKYTPRFLPKSRKISIISSKTITLGVNMKVIVLSALFEQCQDIVMSIQVFSIVLQADCILLEYLPG